MQMCALLLLLSNTNSRHSRAKFPQLFSLYVFNLVIWLLYGVNALAQSVRRSQVAI